MKQMNFEQKVISIQTELKAPKNQYNSFGKYRYRNQEDILEAVKPLLSKHELSITLTDTIKETNSGICYVEARAILHGTDGKIESVAQAGIDINKKGMDISQSFGSSSSYARKYALNGLLLIDDTKDADSTNTHDTSNLKWLNEGTPEFTKAMAYVKKGGKVNDIKKKYNVSKTVENRLTKIKSNG
tara:strand:+ start:2656 stop:3213 length:558 start_codon:yes stop_codon:yes gene_type:complete